MRRIGCAGRRQVGGDEFTFAADRESDPVERGAAAARGDEIEAAIGELFPREALGDVADRDDASTAEDDAVNFGCAMCETKDAAWRDEFGDVFGLKGEATFTETE